jgi:hypothetical protein
MHSKWIWRLVGVIAGALTIYAFAFPGLVHAHTVRDPNCQTVVIQPHRDSSYTFLARQCGDLKAPPVGEMWAEIGTDSVSHQIQAVPVPIASPSPSP